MVTKRYVRVGDLPATLCSRNFRDGVTEAGVSVFDAAQVDGAWGPLLATPAQEAFGCLTAAWVTG